MTRPYSIVLSSIWDDHHSLAIPLSAVVIRLYLLTCPQSNAVGYYRLQLSSVRKQFRWTEMRILEALSALHDCGIATYYPTVDQIIVHEAYSHLSLGRSSVLNAIGSILTKKTLPRSLPTPLADHLDVLRTSLASTPDSAAKSKLCAILDAYVAALRAERATPPKPLSIAKEPHAPKKEKEERKEERSKTRSEHTAKEDVRCVKRSTANPNGA